MHSKKKVFVNRNADYLQNIAVAYAKDYNLDEVVLAWYQDRSLSAYDVHKDQERKKKKKKQRAKPRKFCLSRVKTKRKIFTLPISMDRFWLSSGFGKRRRADGSWGFHNGIDMAALKGTPVCAAAQGIVIEAGWGRGYGKTIVISHAHGFKTRYAHLDKILVRVGSRVKQGALIGRVGDTGSVRKKGKDASHLHFEVSEFGKRVNPFYYIVA